MRNRNQKDLIDLYFEFRSSLDTFFTLRKVSADDSAHLVSMLMLDQIHAHKKRSTRIELIEQAIANLRSELDTEHELEDSYDHRH